MSGCEHGTTASWSGLQRLGGDGPRHPSRDEDGIFNFMIQGLQKLLTDLGKNGVLTTTKTQKSRVSRFIDESDSLRIFLRSNLALSLGNGDNITANELLDAYYKHCIDNELNSLSTKEANKALVEIMKELFGRTLINSVKRGGGSSSGTHRPEQTDHPRQYESVQSL
jgi:hypothetical protein